MVKERLSFIDVAKGIGILLVIYGHAIDGNSYRHLIYTFHMPLFFFLSGIVFHHKKHQHFLTFLKKDLKNIMLPYFLFAFGGFLLWITTINQHPLTMAVLQKQLYGIFYGNGNDGYLTYNVILWFLPCLFITRQGFWWLTNVVRSHKAVVISLFFFSVAGYFFSTFFPKIKLLFGIESALTAIVFFGIGYIANTQSHHIKTFVKNHTVLLSMVFLILCICIGTIALNLYGTQFDLRMNRLHNYFLFYSGAFSGILATLSISILIKRNTILEYLGRQSLILFAWHYIIFLYITKLLRLFLSAETMNTWRNSMVAPVYLFGSIIIILIIARFMKPLKAALLEKLPAKTGNR